MTGLFNRRYFNELAQSVLKIDKRNSAPTAVIILDIDKFKNVNDTYGHKVGDEVIILLSKTLQEHSRESDIISRWGGEEFVILLPQTTLEGAKIVAEKLRSRVEALELAISQEVFMKFTISLGVSKVRHAEHDDAESAINCADKALYRAKESGRNRVAVQL